MRSTTVLLKELPFGRGGLRAKMRYLMIKTRTATSACVVHHAGIDATILNILMWDWFLSSYFSSTFKIEITTRIDSE